MSNNKKAQVFFLRLFIEFSYLFEFISPDKEKDKAEKDGHKSFLFEPYVPKEDTKYVPADTSAEGKEKSKREAFGPY